MTERWLLDRAMAMLEVLLDERERSSRRLVMLPPEGATLHEIERAALVAALERCNWVQARAARLLGTSARVMQTKVARYHLYDESPRMRPKQAPRNPFGTNGRHYPRVAGNDWRLKSAELH